MYTIPVKEKVNPFHLLDVPMKIVTATIVYQNCILYLSIPAFFSAVKYFKAYTEILIRTERPKMHSLMVGGAEMHFRLVGGAEMYFLSVSDQRYYP